MNGTVTVADWRGWPETDRPGFKFVIRGDNVYINNKPVPDEVHRSMIEHIEALEDIVRKVGESQEA